MNQHDSHDSRAFERCPTKIPLTRLEAVAEADRLAWPVVPYKCPNGSDHWHVGANEKQAKVFYTNRTRWYKQARTRE